MKRKQLIAVICVLIVLAVGITAAAIVKVARRSTLPQVPQTDTQTQDTQDTQDTTVESQDEQQQVNVPDNTTDEKVPDTTTDKTPQTSEPEPSVPDSSSNIVYNTSVAGSYKEFALTSGMSAKEAYEYLNTFLNSKYSILVNKQSKVGSDYAPTDLVTPQGCDYKLESTAADALVSMLKGARSAGYSDLILYSGYRTYASQKNKYDTRTQKYLDEGYSQEQALELAGQYIAPPGSSEHHTGLAADVCSSKIVSKYGYLDDNFDTTAEYKWLSANCADYGFILRYRKDAQDTTGFLYEPWHYRYIGVEHAKACTAMGITYEEYHAMLLKLRDEAKSEAGV